MHTCMYLIFNGYYPKLLAENRRNTKLHWLLCQNYCKVRIVHATVLAFHYDYLRKVSTKAVCDFHLIKYGIGMIYNLY